MGRTILNRFLWALVVAAILIAAASGLLLFADSHATDGAAHCPTNLTYLQWLGCAMAAHEGLTAGLVGAAGALFAAWLAFDAIQEQMRQESSREQQRNRPWLFLQGATVSRRESSDLQPRIPNNFFIKLHWKNVGRSPAIIERCEFKLVDKDTITAQPDYENSADLTTPAMIAQDAEFETNQFGPAPGTGTKNGEPIRFVLFGRLTYKEVSGIIHHTGFALEISPHIPAFSPHTNRAYDYD